MKVIIKYYVKYFMYILPAIFFLIAEAYCELELPGYMSNIIKYGVASNDLTQIKQYGLQMTIYAVIASVSAILVGFFSSRASAYIAMDLRKDIFSKIITFSFSDFNSFDTSSLITRCTNDVLQIQNFTVSFLRLAMYVPVMGFGGIIKAIEYSSGIQSVKDMIIVSLIAVMLVLIILVIVVIPKFKKMQIKLDELNNVANDELNGMMAIKSFNNQDVEINKFEKIDSELTKTTIFINRITALLVPGMTVVMYTIGIIVLIISAKLVENITQIANLITFIQYAMQIIISFITVSMIFILLPRSIVSTKRVCEILNKKVEIIDETKDMKVETGLIEFCNVSFAYNEEEILKDVSFKAMPNTITAIVGTTGSGKSTLVNLLPRLIDATKGEIKIDGIDIKQLPLKNLRQSIAFVPQNSILFSGDIKSNISYANNNITEEEIVDASIISQSREFIQEKEEQYDFKINQGGNNLSGGQRQRLSIARALAKKAPILILDDSLAALDYNTDLQLRKEIKDKVKDTTIIIISQRINSIKNADNIIVLDQGKIVAEGKHEELKQNSDIYKKIVESQVLEGANGNI